MWRRNGAGFGDVARENEDSDLSISEEDEGVDGEWTQNTVSLGREENDKGKMQVLAQLDMFRESCTEDPISSRGIKRGSQIEDEVEPPIFDDGSSPSHYHGIASAILADSNERFNELQDAASISCSREEIISDEEKNNAHTVRSVRESLSMTWSEAGREVEALVRSNEIPCSSNYHDVFVREKKSTRESPYSKDAFTEKIFLLSPSSSLKRGRSRRKAKTKFSFPCHSDKTDLSLVVSDSNEETSSDSILVADEIGVVADDEMHNNMADSQLNFCDKHIVPFEIDHKHETRGNSMADILSGFLEKNDLQKGSSELEIQKRRREHVPPLGTSIQEDDLPEALDSDNSFDSDDERNAQSIKMIISRTMVDQFHEAFRTVSAIDDTLHASFPRSLCGGMHRKLQHVLQIQKERDMDSLNDVNALTSFNDTGMPVLVRILSRSLEAKLIVCSCIRVEDGKNFSRETRNMTIIYNPRMSKSAELEVDNMIRIHPPWKEVHVKDEVIFLCSYFSQAQ